MPFWYYPFIFVLPGGKILYAGPEILFDIGGEFNGLPLVSLLLDLAEPSSTRRWRKIGQDVGATFFGGSAVMYEPGKVFKSGTPKDHNSDMTNKAAFIDCSDLVNNPNPQWTLLANMNSPRSMHNSTVLPDGSILITGGTSTGLLDEYNAVLGAEMYRPGATWTHLTMAAMSTARLYHSTAILLPDARVLVGGGEEAGDFGGTVRKGADIFEPPYLHTGTARPTIGTGTPSSVKLNNLIKIYTPDVNAIEKISWVKLGAVTHAFDQDQRFVPGPLKGSSDWTTGADVTGTYIQIKAPLNGFVAPPGYYMLFIMKKVNMANWGGRDEYVPSVGKFVKLISPVTE